MEKVKNHETIVDFYNVLQEVPKKDFIEHKYYATSGSSKCCALGHYDRVRLGRKLDLGLGEYLVGVDNQIEKIRRTTVEIYGKLHPDGKDDRHWPNIANINNEAEYNGYTHQETKDRVICFLEDYLEATGEITQRTVKPILV